MRNRYVEEQVASHRATIALLQSRIELFESCGMSKSANHARQIIKACESCIRACERVQAENEAL